MKNKNKVVVDYTEIFSKDESEKNYKVYRYDPISYFRENVRQKRLVFSAIENWDDRLEQLFVDKGGWSSNDVACLCFTTNATENSAAAWKMHKKTNGQTLVQIELDFKRLVEIFNEWLESNPSYSVYVKKVSYLDGDELKKLKCDYGKKKYSAEEYVRLLSVKRKDFSFEGEVRFFILRKKISFDKKDEPKLFFAELKNGFTDAINKISLEPYSAEAVKAGAVKKREDDEELQSLIDFVKYRISSKINESRFVQRKRLYEKIDV